jgi:dienelactone hydrolase
VSTFRVVRFELTGADGGPLRGDVRSAGAGRPAVVICHGFKGFKDWGMFPRLAERLARAGFTAVSFNFSGSGVGPDGESFDEPGRFAQDTYLRQLADLETVVRAARSGALAPGAGLPARLGLLGHSRGGGVATLFAAGDGDVAALVTWAGIASVRRWSDEVIAAWRHDGKLDVVNARTGQVLELSTAILDEMDRYERSRLDIPAAAGRVRAPWLIVHGDEDEAVPLEHARILARANPGAALCVVRGAGHTFGARHPWQGSTPALDEALDRTVEWFGRHLL